MIYYFLNYELHLYIHQLLAVCRKNFFRSHWFFGQSTFCKHVKSWSSIDLFAYRFYKKCTFMQDFAIARDGFIIMFYIQYFVACLCFFFYSQKELCNTSTFINYTPFRYWSNLNRVFYYEYQKASYQLYWYF